MLLHHAVVLKSQISTDIKVVDVCFEARFGNSKMRDRSADHKLGIWRTKDRIPLMKKSQKDL